MGLGGFDASFKNPTLSLFCEKGELNLWRMHSLPHARQSNHKWILFMRLDTAIGYLLSTISLDGWEAKKIKRHKAL
jgi:hypothetical protein